jgi:hypothetical protein
MFTRKPVASRSYGSRESSNSQWLEVSWDPLVVFSKRVVLDDNPYHSQGVEKTYMDFHMASMYG